VGFIIIHHCSQEFALQIHIYDPGNSASLRQRPKTPENLFYPFTLLHPLLMTSTTYFASVGPQGKLRVSKLDRVKH